MNKNTNSELIKIIKIDPYHLEKHYDKLDEDTSFGHLSEIEIDIRDLTKEIHLDTSNVVDDRYNYIYDFLTDGEQSVALKKFHETVSFNFNFINGFCFRRYNNYCDQLEKDEKINHLATAIVSPDEYFNNKITVFYHGSCYLIRKNRHTYKYSSCTLEQFISEYNHKDHIVRRPTKIKEINGAYHIIKVSPIVDFIKHNISY